MDLFADLPGQAAPEKPVRIKRSGLYAALPGSGPAGETCGSCKHCDRAWNGRYRKCELVRAHWTGGPGTDIKARSPACSKWESDKPSPAEVAVEQAQARYDKTHSRRAWFDLERARREALSAPRVIGR